MSERPPPTSYRDERGVFHPGPGVTRGELARRRHAGESRKLQLSPQHVMPCAVAVALVSYLLDSLSPWWLAAPLLAGLLALLVAVGRRVELDRLPHARVIDQPSDARRSRQ